ncbi:hypothetical protein ACIRP0_30255 [Streptomyces sp. NPDC101733]|uniref:hypothetical protein n=1 Tax=unclassified Streptomyces TaxID=2593676 RepID=UPI00382527D7
MMSGYAERWVECRAALNVAALREQRARRLKERGKGEAAWQGTGKVFIQGWCLVLGHPPSGQGMTARPLTHGPAND